MSDRPDSETPLFPDDGVDPAEFTELDVIDALDDVDPNADIIGFQYVTAEGTPGAETVTVIETVPWSKASGGQYVTVRFQTGHETIKLAGAVRRVKELDA
jgi:hypothetical protein